MSTWIKFNNWFEKHERVLMPLVGVLLVAAILFCLFGCGTSSDRQTQTLETEKFVTPPIVIDTTYGQFTIQPATFYRQREVTEVEHTDKHINVPEVKDVLQAAAGGLPFGGIISGVIGLGVAAFAGKKALDSQRQRNEVIDSFEKVTDHMTDEQWEKAKTKIKQSPDTKAVVKARIS